MVEWKKLLKGLGRNVLVFVIGAVIGFIISFLYTTRVWLPTQGPDIGIAILGVFPVVLILLGLVGIIIGGVLGVVFYNIYIIIKRKRK
jgi:hypothetical protein